MFCVKTKPEQYSSLEQIEFQNAKTESWVSRNSIFIFATQKLCEKRIISRNITMTTCTNSESTDQQHLRVKFLGDKKGPTIGFYLEVWKISSVFLYQVYLLNYQLCTVHIFVKVCIYVCGTWLRELKRDWNMILNSHFQKLKCLPVFQTLPQKCTANNREA